MAVPPNKNLVIHQVSTPQSPGFFKQAIKKSNIEAVNPVGVVGFANNYLVRISSISAIRPGCHTVPNQPIP